MAIITTKTYNVYIDEPLQILKEKIAALEGSKYFVLVDENTREHCLPTIINLCEGTELNIIEIRSGEENKTLDTCQDIWSKLTENGGDRKSVLINLGGGVIGDMGGFAASCFMRGMRFVHIPTTLLSQVDASVGSKLGIDYKDIKNLIGLFNDPEFVFIHSPFLKTLPLRQLKSGFAETIKHALIKSNDLWNELKIIDSIENISDWTNNIFKSVSIKNNIVNEDPYERGLRKILNFGHTIGHAIESSKLHTNQPLLHGEAIITGMLVESYIACKSKLLSMEAFKEIESFFVAHYPYLFQKDYQLEDIIPFLQFDKKKVGDTILFALIDRIGAAQYDVQVSNQLINEAFNETLIRRDD